MISLPTAPSAGARLPVTLTSFITNFKEPTEKSFRSFEWANKTMTNFDRCNKKKTHFSFLLDKLEPASYFILQTF